MRCNQRFSQSGGALIETTLVLPVLLLVVFGISRFLYISQTYLSLNLISREAVLPASTTANASHGERVNLDPTSAEVEVCLQSASPNGDCAHIIAHWRIRKLLKSNHLDEHDFNFSSIRNTDGISVKIGTNPDSKITVLGSAIKVSAHADYLGVE